MLIYFVRHGETTHNQSQLHQGPHAHLTDKGRLQAKFVVERLKGAHFDIILSSPFIRAKDTAEIINQTLGKEIIFTELLREIMQPSELHGKHYDEPESVHIRNLLRNHAADQNWHYSDEENFADYTKRARDFLHYLLQFEGKNPLVITHGGFLWVLMGILLCEDDLTPELYWRIRQFFFATNTGVTVVEKTPEWGWQLKTWNDYAHLQDIEEKSNAGY